MNLIEFANSLEEQGIEIHAMCGCAPVQLHAVIQGKHLYFRARHQHWSIAIADTEDLSVGGEPDECHYYAVGQYGTDHESSYLPDEHAIAIIQSAIQIFGQVRIDSQRRSLPWLAPWKASGDDANSQ